MITRHHPVSLAEELDLSKDGFLALLERVRQGREAELIADQWHLTLMVADILTIAEHSDAVLDQTTLCFLGDARNEVASALLLTGTLLGMDVRIAGPRELWPAGEIINEAEDRAVRSGAQFLITSDLGRAVPGADFLYTDRWGRPEETIEQRLALVPKVQPYRVTAELMAATGKPHARFLHPRPTVRGGEVSDEVIVSSASLVGEQAANRERAIRAIMVDPWTWAA